MGNVQLNQGKQERKPVPRGIGGKPLTEEPRRYPSTSLPVQERRFSAPKASEEPAPVPDKDALHLLSNANDDCSPKMKSLLSQIMDSKELTSEVREAARKALYMKDEISSLQNE